MKKFELKFVENPKNSKGGDLNGYGIVLRKNTKNKYQVFPVFLHHEDIKENGWTKQNLERIIDIIDLLLSRVK